MAPSDVQQRPHPPSAAAGAGGSAPVEDLAPIAEAPSRRRKDRLSRSQPSGEPPLAVMDAEALVELVAQANLAAGGARRDHADALSEQLVMLGRRPATRENADLLRRLLEGGELRELSDSQGRSCRALATEALVAMGYPYALEVSPEDLEHLRESSGGGRRRLLLFTGLFAVLLFSGLELFTSLLGARAEPLLALHAVLGILSASAVAITRRGGSARKLAVGALALCAAEGLVLTWVGSPGALLPALGAAAAVILMTRTK